jgi:hypothetical protein
MIRPTSAPQGDITGFLQEAEVGGLIVESSGVESLLITAFDDGVEGSLLQANKTKPMNIKNKNLIIYNGCLNEYQHECKILIYEM